MSSLLRFGEFEDSRSQKGEFDKWFAKDKSKAAVLDEVMDFLHRKNCTLRTIYPAIYNQNNKLLPANNQNRNQTVEGLFSELIQDSINSQYAKKQARSRKAKEARARKQAERAGQQVPQGGSQNN